MPTKLVPNALYRLGSELLRYAPGDSHLFLMAKGTNAFDKLKYLIAYDHIYRLTVNAAGALEWQATDQTVRELQRVQ